MASAGWDLIVVGGGVIGLALAREAAGEGARVLLVERGPGPTEASWAAAGMLSPFGEASSPGPFLEIASRSLELWPTFAEALEEEVGSSIEYRPSGKVALALTDHGWTRLRERHEWGAPKGAGSRLLDPGEVFDLLPGAPRELRGGLLSSADHRIDNRALGGALLAACRRRGVEVRTGTEVTSVETDKGVLRGVRAGSDTLLPAPRVVLAAGAWGGSLEGLPSPPPIRPVRGQMVALRPSSPPDPRILESEEVYLVPRDDGRLLVGATVEEVGFRREVTVDGITGLLAGALRLDPTLRSAPVEELWCGFRPGTPDGLPILGPDPEVPGVIHAGGHFRNGILLAPVTVEFLTPLLLGGEGVEDALAPFSPARFPVSPRSSHLDA